MSVDELIQSVGATAEMMKLIFDNFKRVGFNDSQALELTKTELKTIISNAKGE